MFHVACRPASAGFPDAKLMKNFVISIYCAFFLPSYNFFIIVSKCETVGCGQLYAAVVSCRGLLIGPV